MQINSILINVSSFFGLPCYRRINPLLNLFSCISRQRYSYFKPNFF